MEKRVPHCQLGIIRALIDEGKVRPTTAAASTARALGFNVAEMISIVRALTMQDFYKSMTTYADHTVWQDVYHCSTRAGDVYLKLTVIDYVLIVSFKEL